MLHVEFSKCLNSRVYILVKMADLPRIETLTTFFEASSKNECFHGHFPTFRMEK